MHLKPKKCCGMGEYKCQIPMPIKGRIHGIDYCIADIVAALNAANLTTVASCCGHGVVTPVISLEDGRQITLKEGLNHFPICGSCEHEMTSELEPYQRCGNNKADIKKAIKTNQCNYYESDKDV